jgi:copper chaperone
MIQLHVANMNCGGCANGVTRAVQGLDQTATIDVDLPAKEIAVSSSAGSAALIAALKSAGYEATLAAKAAA